MKRFKTARALALIGFSSVSLIAARGLPRVPGITFDMVTTTAVESMMQPGAPPGGMTVTGAATADGRTRMEIVSVTGPNPMVAGDYFLVVDGNSLIVHPSTKTYVDVVDQAMTMMNKMPPEMLSQLKVDGISGTIEKVPGAEKIEGRAADHYRTTVSYTINMMGQSLPSTVTSDYWAVKLPVRFTNPLIQGAKKVPDGPMAEMVKKQIELAPPFGDAVPVKTVIVTRVSVQGQDIVTTITSELKNIKEDDVDASRMAIPAGYTKAAQ